MSETVLYDRAGDIGTVTLNRPDSLNSLDRATKEALRTTLEEAADDDTRAILLTGAGRAFCVGQDLKEHAADLRAGASLGDPVRELYNPIVRALTEMPKPVVAAVGGTAAGAGASLALACDFRVIGSSATFAMAFASIGLTADSGASWLLPRLIGRARAMEMLMLAEPVGAQRALELGLATTVVDDGEVPDKARELAARLASGPTVAYHTIRSSLDYGHTHELEETLELEAELQAACGATEDHREATFAFVDKRKPEFKGR